MSFLRQLAFTFLLVSPLLLRGAEPDWSKIESHLIPVDHFILHYTDNGFVYHGIKAPWHLDPIILDRKFALTDRASAGHGVFLANQYGGALEYGYNPSAGWFGLVLKLRVPKDRPLRIIRADGNLKHLPDADQLRRESIKKGRVAWADLAERYKIDIVIDYHPQAQTMDALIWPQSYDEVARSIIEYLEGPIEGELFVLEGKINALASFKGLARMAEAKGKPLAVTMEDAQVAASWGVGQYFPQRHSSSDSKIVSFLNDLEVVDSELRERFEEGLEFVEDKKIRTNVVGLMDSFGWNCRSLAKQVKNP